MSSTSKTLPPPAPLSRVTDPAALPATAPCELNIFMQSHLSISECDARAIANMIASAARDLNHTAEVVAVAGRFDITSNGNRIGYIRYQ